jgi:hypothetical protein
MCTLYCRVIHVYMNECEFESSYFESEHDRCYLQGLRLWWQSLFFLPLYLFGNCLWLWAFGQELRGYAKAWALAGEGYHWCPAKMPFAIQLGESMIEIRRRD